VIYIIPHLGNQDVYRSQCRMRSFTWLYWSAVDGSRWRFLLLKVDKHWLILYHTKQCVHQSGVCRTGADRGT
jgi:hypothetical protein